MSAPQLAGSVSVAGCGPVPPPAAAAAVATRVILAVVLALLVANNLVRRPVAPSAERTKATCTFFRDQVQKGTSAQTQVPGQRHDPGQPAQGPMP